MKNILVADDSVTIQKVIALTFADEPFEVQSVGTGAEALEKMSTWKPDILLADVIMPQMNGYELCRAVKEQQETSSIPVLLLAGTFEAFDEEEAKSVGADGYITKPFESGELIEKVNTLIGGKPEAAPAEEPQAEVPQLEVTEVEPLQMESPQTGLSQVEAPPAEPPFMESVPPEAAPEAPPVVQPTAEQPPLEPPPIEPRPAETVQAESPQIESPPMETFDIGGGEPALESMPEPDRASEAAPGPVGAAPKSEEPDIWDILSDTGSSSGVSDIDIAGDVVPGMGPIEDQGVVDVGSFDVGLDRPEQVETAPEPQGQPDEKMFSFPAEPEPVGQVQEEPPTQPVSGIAGEFPSEQPEQLSPEKSRVEDREKDFFGFETEVPESTTETDYLGGAVEEITFEIEEPASPPADADPEASFIVPEPAENEIPVPGETIAPEVLAPEQPVQPDQPPQMQEFMPAQQEAPGAEPSPEFASPLDEQVFSPVTEETNIAADDFQTAFIPEQAPAEMPPSSEQDLGGLPEKAVIEPSPDLQTSEPQEVPEAESAFDVMAAQAPEEVRESATGEPADDQIRKIIEEKVEKIVWEVVPEMAEVLIREAIEKIKGKQ